MGGWEEQAQIDVHAATAAWFYDVEVEAVTRDQRQVAKIANYRYLFELKGPGT